MSIAITQLRRRWLTPEKTMDEVTRSESAWDPS